MPASPALAASDDFCTRTWDAVVIGAGPAGAVAAILLARRGGSVLLLERSAWPRDKVCGGCVGPRAMQLLDELGLRGAVAGGRPLDHAVISAGSDRDVSPSTDGRPNRIRSASVPTSGRAISRRALDAALVERFIALGGTFVSNASAQLVADDAEDIRELNIGHGGDSFRVRARCVIAADGIAGRSLEHEPWAAWRIDRHARIGVEATIGRTSAGWPPGAVHMHVGVGGYFGVVRFADHSTHLAAALSPAACRHAGGPRKLIQSIARSCGREISIDEHSLHGTPALTRRRPTIAGHRVLAVGDACGYIEPFTGEGIGWAIASARAAVDLLPQSPSSWPSDFAARWRATHDSVIGRQQKFCRIVRAAVRQPVAVRVSLAAMNLWPALARWAASGVAQDVARSTS